MLVYPIYLSNVRDATMPQERVVYAPSGPAVLLDTSYLCYVPNSPCCSSSYGVLRNDSVVTGLKALPERWETLLVSYTCLVSELIDRLILT
jgi:hypothetical protein